MTKEEWLSKLFQIEHYFDTIKNSYPKSDIRDIFLGKKGELTLLLKKISEIPVEHRKEVGLKGNELKKMIEEFVTEDYENVSEVLNEIDITLPSKKINFSFRHPITITLSKIIESFKKLGFSLEWGPLVEEDFYNFKALNFPDHHPARDMQDTFYIDGLFDSEGKNLILRTHTSPVQIRTMLKYKPPLRVISPGRVFRSEAVDATHSFVFNQIEGFYVDSKVNMCDLKWALENFIKDLFGNSAKIKFMPSYFPFVEPGAQVEVSCVFCSGRNINCKVCKGVGWLEMLGAGIIHPNVLKNCGYDPYQWSGFAFGAGIERFTMLLFGIDDLRTLYENDLRILRQVV
ncbi:MAG: phenylalanine--tRNA ligase subunit alpha [Elusimicrobiales bacterium]|nr:phenylalanine--tRNA ligase subunit alpha [Elusimicrobiales bacterium]